MTVIEEALNHPASNGATPDRDNSSRVTTVDRVARIETVETSSPRRKAGGGYGSLHFSLL